MAARSTPSRLLPKHKGGYKPGQSGNPKGRPKGAKDKRTLLREKLVREREAGRLTPAQLAVLTPLDFALSILRDPDSYNKVDRMWAAHEAFPYMHRKMPTAIEGGDKPLAFLAATKLASMSPKELRVLEATLIALGVTTDEEAE